MTKTMSSLVLQLAAALLLAGCSSDADRAPPAADGAAALVDFGGFDDVDAGAPFASEPDAGVAFSGPDGCRALVQCVQGCGEGNESCVEQCMWRADPAVRELLVALVQCFESNRRGKCAAHCVDGGPDQACQACMTDSCVAERAACIGDVAPPDAGAADGSITGDVK